MAGAETLAPVPAQWYFDVVSPFAYLHLCQQARWHPRLQVQFVPVLFGGILRELGTRGPAEIPGKRMHTYEFCAYAAAAAGIAFRMPPRHPFNPLHVQRLLVATGAAPAQVRQAFDFVWAQGRDPGEEFDALATALGVADARRRSDDATARAGLRANTAQALAAGVFGVPAMVVRGRVFWGADTIDWMNAYVDDPELFGREPLRSVREVGPGVERRP